MGQFDKEQILNNSLTGASFNSNLNFYDETASYIIGDKVFWQLITYECTAAVTGSIEGDLTNAPNLSANWKAIVPAIFNVYPSTIQTFTTTRIDVLLDTIRKDSDNFSLNIATGEITCNVLGDYIIMVTASIQINGSSASRSGSNTFLQINTGSGYSDIPSFKISEYHRQDSADEETATFALSFPMNIGDKIKLQSVRYVGGAVLETIPSGISVVIFNTGGGSKGEKGDKGDKGDVGPSGDIVWRGAYDNGTTYNIYDTIEYQGSTYTCVTNGTLGDTPPSVNWELVAQKGADGAGATITIQDSNGNIPNTPHGTLNFIDDISAVDAGSGVTNISVIHPTIPKNTYVYPIWAEENAGLGNSTYEWAYGNGASTPNDGGVTIFVPPGYTARVIAMSLRLNSGTATVELVHNGTVQGSNCDVTVSSGQGNTNNSFTPISISNGDYLNFRTTTASGTAGPNVVTAWIECTEI